MTLVDLVGYVAACLTTLSFVPQAWLIYRTRNVSGVSLGMYGVFTAGVTLWMIYGLMVRGWPVVVANAVTLVLALLIVAMKIRYGRG